MTLLSGYQSAGQAAYSVFLSNIVGAGVGLANLALMAYYFGAGRDIEIYFAAYTFYTLILKLSLSGVLGEVLIPYILVTKSAKNMSNSWAIVSNLVNLMGVIGVVYVILFGTFNKLAIELIVPGFSGPEQLRVIKLFILLSPVVVLTLTSIILSAVLNAYEQFGRPEIAKAIAHSLGLITLVLLAQQLGPTALVASYWVYSLSYLMSLLWLLRRLGYRHSWRLDWQDKIFKQILRAMRPYIPYTIVSQAVQYAMIAILTTLPEGAYGVYAYVQTLYNQINKTFFRAIPTVALTWFSDATAKQDLSKLRQRLTNAVQMLIFTTAPVSLAISLLSYPIVHLLWSRGQFAPKEAELATSVLSIVAITFLFDGVLLLLRRVLVSLKRTGLVNIVNITIQILFVSMIYLLTPLFGVRGVVSAHLLITVIGVFLFWIALRFNYKTVARFINPMFFIKVLSLLTVAGTLSWYSKEMLLQFGWGEEFLGLIGLAGISGAALFVVYVGGSLLLRIQEASEIVHVIVHKFLNRGSEYA